MTRLFWAIQAFSGLRCKFGKPIEACATRRLAGVRMLCRRGDLNHPHYEGSSPHPPPARLHTRTHAHSPSVPRFHTMPPSPPPSPLMFASPNGRSAGCCHLNASVFQVKQFNSPTDDQQTDLAAELSHSATSARRSGRRDGVLSLGQPVPPHRDNQLWARGDAWSSIGGSAGRGLRGVRKRRSAEDVALREGDGRGERVAGAFACTCVRMHNTWARALPKQAPPVRAAPRRGSLRHVGLLQV
jgi:hypothetical protein